MIVEFFRLLANRRMQHCNIFLKICHGGSNIYLLLASAPRGSAINYQVI